MAYNDEANKPHYPAPENGLQRQPDAIALCLLRLLLRLAASLLMRPTTTRTNPRNPLRFAFLNFELVTETGDYPNAKMRYQPKQPFTVKPWLSLLGFVQFAVRFLPDYIASY